ncbi:MAG: Mur ligase [Bacteroidia bacterium]|nr:MAG: Mur ligase [Bacteroidia bacterium]
MNKGFLFLILLISIFIYVLRSLHDLHMMQQNSYRNERYLRWLKTNFLKPAKYAEFALILIFSFALTFNWIPLSIVFTIVLAISVSLSFFRKKYKKKLVFTKRAKRLFFTNLFLFLIISLTIAGFQNLNISISVVLWLFFFSSGVILSANFVLKPIEASINRYFYKDAKKRLQSMPELLIIGITGSYGKTSTKHFLHRILSEKYNVLMTPGSFNTSMGVIRTIREQLKPVHEIFIVEMGAKQIGDIREICELVNPKIGILTAVAEQHLDTFKTIENVKHTKFELLNALPKNGTAILNADYKIIYDEKAKLNTKSIFYSTTRKNTDCFAENIVYTRRGMKFDLSFANKKITQIETKLLGEYNISNILAAVVVALELNMPEENIKYAIRKIESVKHRLEVKRKVGGVTIIDDAFNSNPIGAAMAVEVLGKIEGKKKIIITPGMIELGNKAQHYNEKFGEQIAKNCDIAILVGPKQTKPIQEALKKAGFVEKNMYIARNLTEANTYMRSIVENDDVVLYENDLPDIFNE